MAEKGGGKGERQMGVTMHQKGYIYKRNTILILIVLSLSGCSNEKDKKIAELTKKVEEQSKLIEQPTHQLPTATEVFNLRTECVKLGELILNENVVGSALTHSVASNYNSKKNRCYVELTVQSADFLVKEPDIYRTYLYDGQTKDVLAYAIKDKGKESGIVFNPSSFGYDTAVPFIYEKMNDNY